MSADMYSDLKFGLGIKNYPKMTPHKPKSVHWFQSYGKVFSMSADLYSDLNIGLGMKNYYKMTPHMPQSAHWFQSYEMVFFQVS